MHCIFHRFTLYYIWKELIHIKIEIQKPNRFKDFLHKIFNRLENFIFALFQRIPEKFMPSFLMNWMEHYTNKRIADLQQQIIRNRWYNVELEKAVDKIHNKQQD